MKNFAAIPKEQFQQDQTRSNNRFSDQNVVKELTSVARIFDWGGGQTTNHMQWRHQIFSKEELLWENIVDWKIWSRGTVWHLTRILLKGKGLNH